MCKCCLFVSSLKVFKGYERVENEANTMLSVVGCLRNTKCARERERGCSRCESVRESETRGRGSFAFVM